MGKTAISGRHHSEETREKMSSKSDHSKTGKDREKWEAEFTEIIEKQYGGRCYLRQGEQTTTAQAGG